MGFRERMGKHINYASTFQDFCNLQFNVVVMKAHLHIFTGDDYMQESFNLKLKQSSKWFMLKPPLNCLWIHPHKRKPLLENCLLCLQKKNAKYIDLHIRKHYLHIQLLTIIPTFLFLFYCYVTDIFVRTIERPRFKSDYIKPPLIIIFADEIKKYHAAKYIITIRRQRARYHGFHFIVCGASESWK